MRVLIVDKNAEALTSAKESLGDVTALETDVSQLEEWQSLRAIVERDFGGKSSGVVDGLYTLADETQAGLTSWRSMPGGEASARGTTSQRSRPSMLRMSGA